MEKSDQIKQLQERIEKVRNEQIRLANSSYSQSDPGAVMDRRFVNRELAKLEKQLEEVTKK
jgi:hypothetical protein